MPIAIIVILVVFGLGLVWLIYSFIWGTPPTINLAVNRLGLRWVLQDPEGLTEIGLMDNTLLDFHSGSLTDASPQYMEHLRQLDRDGLTLIRRYDAESLTGQQAVTYHMIRWYYEQNLRGHRFDYHWISDPVFMGPYPVNQVFGVQLDLIRFLCLDHKIKGRRSMRRYLQRLEEVGWKLGGLQDSLLARSMDGVIPPRFVLEKVLRQIENFVDQPLEENPLYTSFLTRMADAGRLNPAVQGRWGQRVLAAIKGHVLPAYEELAENLEDLLDQAPTDDGVWRLPDGEAYYAFLLRQHTTTDIAPEAVHDLGLDEVDRLTEEVRAVLHEMGLPDEDPIEQLQALMDDPAYQYRGEDREGAILRDYQAILDEVNEELPGIFSYGPLDRIVVRRLPVFKESDSPIAYAQPPSAGGDRPGTMWINLRDTDNVYRWGMRTLAYHEGIPGHIYQMAQAQKNMELPFFRRYFFFNAYIEGWALYAERLGWELDPTEPASNLGRLQALLWRAARLVVDTGIHIKKWSRQEAIDYMSTATGLPEADVVTEVERYIVMPGQACAYYIGYLRLLALRQKAEATLGTNFDLKEFHDVIINNGGLPLDLLERVVNYYVDQAAGIQP
ncbi:DUF885 domain-containing protein [bacterium]|nr:DUF885 domain-containing protein [bacterium]